MRLFLFIFLCAAHCNGQMLGGRQVADNKEFPYVVKAGYCTGVIIHKHYVLTAAHCVKNVFKDTGGAFEAYERIQIAAGDRYLTIDPGPLDAHERLVGRSETRRIITSDEIIPHPEYVRTYAEKDNRPAPNPQNDLALLYFKDALFEDGDEHVKSIEMVAEDERWNVKEDLNVGYKYLRTWQPAYQDSYHIQGDFEYWNGRPYPVYTSRIPYDHYKNENGHWVAFVPPAGSRCLTIGLGVTGQKEAGLKEDGKKKWEDVYSNIKTADESEVYAYDFCKGYKQKYEPFRNFCFGMGLNHGGAPQVGDSGAPVVCFNPGENDYKLYGIVTSGDGKTHTDAVRLAHGGLNRWVNDEMQKNRNVAGEEAE